MKSDPDSNPIDPHWREVPKVKAWEQSLRNSGCSLDSLEPLNILNKRDGNLLFALVAAKGHDPEGKPLLPYALLRGPACVVVPVCRNKTTGEKKFLMIHQRRIGHGGLSLEFPAGMLDEDLNDPIETAVRELEEETGMRVAAANLIPLWDRALFSSPGLSDESIYFYSTVIDVDEEKWSELEGAETGHANEGEFITTTLKTFAEGMSELNSVQPLLGLLLYQGRYGVIP